MKTCLAFLLTAAAITVTAEDIKAAAAKYLNTDNHALLDVVPAGKEEK